MSLSQNRCALLGDMHWADVRARQPFDAPCDGAPGGRRFRQLLSDADRLKSGGPELLLDALAAVEPAELQV